MSKPLTFKQIVDSVACPYGRCQAKTGKRCVNGKAFGPFVIPHKSRYAAALANLNRRKKANVVEGQPK